VTSEQNATQSAVGANRPRDLLSKLYREIGIPAVAAALEAGGQQKPSQGHQDIPPVLRNDEAA
jgi:hypothetical protein